MALEARGVSFSYGKGSEFQQPALFGVDLRLDTTTGPMLIAGRTGSGKSTLLRLMSGLLAPQEGSIAIDGVAGARPSAGGPGGVGLVFQSPETQLFEETVLDDVMFGPRNQGLDPAAAESRARRALELVGLGDREFESRSPFTLSGGEARRVAIAGVVALGPAYLLMDEPLAGLDAEGRSTMLALIDSMRETTAIAVVSHDIDELIPHCSSALLLDGGAAVFRGGIEELVEDPTVLLDAGLRLTGLLAVRAEAAARGITMSGVPFEPAAMAGAILESRGMPR